MDLPGRFVHNLELNECSSEWHPFSVSSTPLDAKARFGARQFWKRGLVCWRKLIYCEIKICGELDHMSMRLHEHRLLKI